MKRLWLSLSGFACTALAVAQGVPEPTPVPTPLPPGVVVPVPEPIVAWIAGAFAVGAMLYKLLDGLKNFIPSLKENPTLVKILNFAGSFLALAGACFALGMIHDAFDLLKCVGAAVISSLTAAGFYEGKKQSDLARAGGAAQLVNVKAVSEVESPSLGEMAVGGTTTTTITTTKPKPGK